MSRRVKQRTIAEASAPIFARPAQATTTPTGTLPFQVAKKLDSKESWPGTILINLSRV